LLKLLKETQSLITCFQLKRNSSGLPAEYLVLYDRDKNLLTIFKVYEVTAYQRNLEDALTEQEIFELFTMGILDESVANKFLHALYNQNKLKIFSESSERGVSLMKVGDFFYVFYPSGEFLGVIPMMTQNNKEEGGHDDKVQEAQ